MSASNTADEVKSCWEVEGEDFDLGEVFSFFLCFGEVAHWQRTEQNYQDERVFVVFQNTKTRFLF